MINKKYSVDDFGIKRWKNSEGQLHREDGPAREWANGHKEWYLNGRQFISEENWIKELRNRKLALLGI